MLFLFAGGDKTKDQKFGIEIELTGLTRAKAADIVAEYFGTEAYHVGGSYDPYTVSDEQNRKWKIVRDGSIRCADRNGNSLNSECSVEFVSPICVYDDIETIQQLVRNLRAGGAVANSSCGIHIHINGAPYDAKSLRNLTNIMNSNEFALTVSEMSRSKLVKFKAVLEAEQPESVSEAINISAQLDDYEFDPSVTNFRDYGEKYLSEMLPPEFDRSVLSDGVTADFGRNISENNGSYLTEYGMLSSAGGQIYSMIEAEQTQQQGQMMFL